MTRSSTQSTPDGTARNATEDESAAVDESSSRDSKSGDSKSGDSSSGASSADSSTGSSSATREFRQDVYAGLGAEQKTLPCKYFYDLRGSELFEQICELPEYYPTRVELALMNRHASEMGQALGPRTRLVEFGSGSSQKTRVLLAHLNSPAGYVPVDVSKEFLLQTAEQLEREFPHIEILPAVADFTNPLRLPGTDQLAETTTVYFPGSTIGNFERDQVEEILEQIRELVGNDGGLLIGIDLHKDLETLEAAYNDEQGVTAEFNLNLLQRINNELSGDFDPERFRHRAIYNSDEHRIEMSLVSMGENNVAVGDRWFQFDDGEEIVTEFSHKYDLDEFAAVAATTGFRLQHVWTDDKQQFAVIYLLAS